MEKSKDYYVGVMDALLATMGKSVEVQKTYVDKIKIEVEKGVLNVKRTGTRKRNKGYGKQY